MNTEKIVYSINYEDILKVAQESYDREFTEDELEIIGEKVGNYIPWYDAIENAIYDHLDSKT